MLKWRGLRGLVPPQEILLARSQRLGGHRMPIRPGNAAATAHRAHCLRVAIKRSNLDRKIVEQPRVPGFLSSTSSVALVRLIFKLAVLLAHVIADCEFRREKPEHAILVSQSTVV